MQYMTLFLYSKDPLDNPLIIHVKSSNSVEVVLFEDVCTKTWL